MKQKTYIKERLLFFSCNTLTFLLFTTFSYLHLGINGWSIIDFFLLFALVGTFPYYIFNFWNVVFGLYISQFRKSKWLYSIKKGNSKYFVSDSKIAVLLTICNEDVERCYSYLNEIITEIYALKYQNVFTFYILSDSSNENIISDEIQYYNKIFANYEGSVLYHHRENNIGYKAGNLQNFCEIYGDNHEYMIPLDADSIMKIPLIFEMITFMQENPKIGILQSVTKTIRNETLFSKICELGSLYDWLYSLGYDYWQGNRGNFWGHNAVIRIKPYSEFCKLPMVSGVFSFGGYIISHDRVEATMMNLCGYEVKYFFNLSGSYEENPPNIIEFLKRDFRWCIGTLQYISLLKEIYHRLHFINYFNIIWSIYLTLCALCETTIIPLILIKIYFEGIVCGSIYKILMLYYVAILLYFFSKIICFTYFIFIKKYLKNYLHYFTICYSNLLLGQILDISMNLTSSMEIIYYLIARKSFSWKPYKRKGHVVSIKTAVTYLYPVALFGILLMINFLWINFNLFLMILPITLSYILIIPLTTITSISSFNRLV